MTHVARLAGLGAARVAIGAPLGEGALHGERGRAHAPALEGGRRELVAVAAERRVAQLVARPQRHGVPAARRGPGVPTRGVAARATDAFVGARRLGRVAADAEALGLDLEARAEERAPPRVRVRRALPVGERGAVATAAALGGARRDARDERDQDERSQHHELLSTTPW
jgi:hypothetical protein